MNTQSMESARQGTGRGKRAGFFRRAGWIGTAMLAGAFFFLIGGIVSLLNNDMSVAIQGFIVSALLIVGSLYFVARRGS